MQLKNQIYLRFIKITLAIFLYMSSVRNVAADQPSITPLSFPAFGVTLQVPGNSVLAFSGDVNQLLSVKIGGANADYVVQDNYLYVLTPPNPNSTLVITKLNNQARSFTLVSTNSSFPAGYAALFASAYMRSEDEMLFRRTGFSPTTLQGDVNADLVVDGLDILRAQDIMAGRALLADAGCAGAVDLDRDGLISEEEYKILFLLAYESRNNSFFLLPGEDNCANFNSPIVASYTLSERFHGEIHLLEDFKSSATLTVTPADSSQISAINTQPSFVEVAPSAGRREMEAIPVVIQYSKAGSYSMTFRYAFFHLPPTFAEPQ